jgi:hypothetical protein
MRPSIDIAYASLEVPMVPDSFAPIIESNAPTQTTSMMIEDSNPNWPNIDEAASTSGLRDDERVDWLTAPRTTRLVKK